MSDVVLEMTGISKVYPGVKALDYVNFRAAGGEVHALVGENGAGKSTLMKILSGVVADYEGEIKIDEKRVNINSPTAAQNAGISIIFQEFNLVNTLSIGENIFLGRLYSNISGFVNWTEIYAKTEELLKKIGLKVNPKTKVKDLSVAEKQMVEIAKALSYNARIIVMDEPSATLTKKELDNLFKIIEDLKKRGVLVIYISHRMEEIFQICDTVTVLRDGKLIDTMPVKNTTKAEIIEKMVGRSMGNEFPQRTKFENSHEEVVLEVNHLFRKGILHDLSFKLYKGEILGIAGLVGAGRTELLRAVFGADKIESGEILIKGHPINIKNPIIAKRQGLALLTEDRKIQGLILRFAVKTNISITKLKGICKFGLLSDRKEEETAYDQIKRLSIKTPSARQKVLNLSGGNQQKVVLGKWLYTDSEILFLDEPTRGIDVGAKYEIYCIMNDLVKAGKSIIMVSSELPEIISMSDRILVMSDGAIKGEIQREYATPERVIACALGNSDEISTCLTAE